MPLALLVALLASVGMHGAALWLPDIELDGPPPVAPPLQATLVLPPRALPATVVPPARPQVRAKPPAKPRPASAPLAAPLAAPPVLPVPPMPEAPSPPAAAPPTEAIALAPPAPLAPPPPEPPPAAALPEAPAAEALPASPAEHLPPRGRIRYTVYRGDQGLMVGEAVHEWWLEADRYRILAITQTAGLAALLRPLRLESESIGHIDAHGLVPERYVSRRIKKGSSEQADFDWAAGTVTVGSGARPLQPGAQDLLSFHYQLGWLPELQSGVQVGIATGKRYERYPLEVRQNVLLETPLGQLRTVYVRVPGERATTEFWLAAERLLLPVKIRHIDREGESFEQIAHRIELPPNEP